MVDINEIMKRRTKKDVISEIIAIVIFVLLSIAFKAYSIEYNVALLKEQDIYGPYVHKICETINPKEALKNFVHYDPSLELSMNTICENEVGKTLIRRMYDAYLTNLDNKIIRPVRILQDYILSNGKPKSNLTHHGKSEVEIYLDPMNLESCIGYKKRGMKELVNTLDSTIFHEMGHAFHGLINKGKNRSIETINSVYKDIEDIKKLWTNDEEFYNITGYFYENGQLKFDPINCNMYEICKACNTINSRSKISQRVFHISYI